MSEERKNSIRIGFSVLYPDFKAIETQNFNTIDNYIWGSGKPSAALRKVEQIYAKFTDGVSIWVEFDLDAQTAVVIPTKYD